MGVEHQAYIEAMAHLQGLADTRNQGRKTGVRLDLETGLLSRPGAPVDGQLWAETGEALFGETLDRLRVAFGYFEKTVQYIGRFAYALPRKRSVNAAITD